eukprot:COSAG01_NODE_162_length_23597_cov_21.924130_25_plen_89_part_00
MGIKPYFKSLLKGGQPSAAPSLWRRGPVVQNAAACVNAGRLRSDWPCLFFSVCSAAPRHVCTCHSAGLHMLLCPPLNYEISEREEPMR